MSALATDRVGWFEGVSQIADAEKAGAAVIRIDRSPGGLWTANEFRISGNGLGGSRLRWDEHAEGSKRLPSERLTPDAWLALTVAALREGPDSKWKDVLFIVDAAGLELDWDSLREVAEQCACRIAVARDVVPENPAAAIDPDAWRAQLKTLPDVVVTEFGGAEVEWVRREGRLLAVVHGSEIIAGKLVHVAQEVWLDEV